MEVRDPPGAPRVARARDRLSPLNPLAGHHETTLLGDVDVVHVRAVVVKDLQHVVIPADAVWRLVIDKLHDAPFDRQYVGPDRQGEVI